MQVTINANDLRQDESVNIGYKNGLITVGFGKQDDAPVSAILGPDYAAPMALPMKNLDHLSWADIDRISKYPNVREYFALGARKKDYMKNGFVAEWQIIGFDHDDLADGSGKACLSWDMVRVYTERIIMSDDGSNMGICEGSTMHRYAHDEFLPLCSDELQAIILPVIKLTSAGNGSKEIVRSACKVWLKSEKELFGRCFYSVPGEGSWYEYYRQEDVPYYKENYEGRHYLNWLRSPAYPYACSCCCVDACGVCGVGAAANARSVAFGFCSGRRTKLEN